MFRSPMIPLLVWNIPAVASRDGMPDEAFSDGQLATASEPRIFRYPPCARHWSMGDICLDHDELGWSSSCSFESFEVHMGEGPRTSSRASGPLSDTNLEGNSEMYYDALASWEVKRQEEKCSDTLSLMVDSMWDRELF